MQVRGVWTDAGNCWLALWPVGRPGTKGILKICGVHLGSLISLAELQSNLGKGLKVGRVA